ncbi:MAG: DUF47 family protein [Clostridia bacterium]|nr:DUF47 family protein [Clostridia bacterium]
MKKRVSFFELLQQQCDLTCKAMESLYEYCQTGDELIADTVIAVEDEADMVRRILIETLNKTYLTPIDREDLFHLSGQLDEIIDYTKTSVDEIRLFKLKPNRDVLKITETLVEMTSHVRKAIQNIEHYPQIVKEEALKVKAYENEIDRLTKMAYADIFETDDFHAIFKYAEVYKHLNHTADIADSAMDFLLDILVKM